MEESEKIRRRSRAADPKATFDRSLLGHGRASAALQRPDEDSSLVEGIAERETLLSKYHDPRWRRSTGKAKGRLDKTATKSGLQKDQNDEMMYELEQGGLYSDADSDEHAQDLLEDGIPELEKVATRKTRVSSCWMTSVLFFLISLTFILLLFGTYQASARSRSRVDHFLSNGTSNFLPTTILVSLDGFRADFLRRGLTPTLNSFIAEGVSPPYMLPSFPSVTFPNHFTLVTGLYPESHGVVGNTFWDPTLQEEFYYTNTTSSMQAKWWAAEPVWITAENQGVKTAIHMWPGSEALIGASYLDKYNGTEELPRKVDRILELLDLPGHDDPEASIRGQRPQLIAAYVPVVDSDGHKYGPNSTEIRSTIARVDDMLRSLFAGLEERNLTKVVSIVVVSDHGMATTSTDRLIQFDDLVDTSLIDHTDGWPLYGLRPKRIDDLENLYESLSSKLRLHPNYNVYLRDKNMPERYHFSKNDRIAPLWIIPRAGWAIVKRAEFDIEAARSRGDVYHPRGLHGYDHEDPLMRAIFVARGPAFPHQPNSKLEVFQNTEVYNIVCDSLSISPKPNNGTLRLPLRPVGLHSDNNNTTAASELPENSPASLSKPSASPSEKVSIGVDQPDAEPGRPVDADGKTGTGLRDKIKEIWNSLLSKFADLKHWVHGSSDSISG